MLGLRYIFVTLALLTFLQPSYAEATILAPDQSEWLQKHKNTLVVRPEKNYPPFSFISSNSSTKPKGLAVDYLELIARKIGAQPTYLEPRSRAMILEDLKSGKEGIALALTESDERSSYLYFSEPFITLPAIIIVRKDYKHSSKELTLGDFNAKQVSITEGSAVSKYIADNYPRIIIESVTDDEVGLQKLLLGEVDAAVMNLASLSYYTSKDMLSYVTVAGQTGFEYKLAFAVPKSMPDLQVILNAGLKDITPTEKEIIKDRWITFPSQQNDKKSMIFPFLSVGAPLWIGISISAGVIILILLIIIIIHNRRHHHLHIASVERANSKKQKLSELTKELEELESANSVLGENMEEIKALERSIQEKIEHIND